MAIRFASLAQLHPLPVLSSDRSAEWCHRGSQELQPQAALMQAGAQRGTYKHPGTSLSSAFFISIFLLSFKVLLFHGSCPCLTSIEWLDWWFNIPKAHQLLTQHTSSHFTCPMLKPLPPPGTWNQTHQSGPVHGGEPFHWFQWVLDPDNLTQRKKWVY